MKGMERVNWLETRKYRRASGVITHRKYIEYKVCMRVNNTQTHTHTHTILGEESKYSSWYRNSLRAGRSRD